MWPARSQGEKYFRDRHCKFTTPVFHPFIPQFNIVRVNSHTSAIAGHTTVKCPDGPGSGLLHKLIRRTTLFKKGIEGIQAGRSIKRNTFVEYRETNSLLYNKLLLN